MIIQMYMHEKTDFSCGDLILSITETDQRYELEKKIHTDDIAEL